MSRQSLLRLILPVLIALLLTACTRAPVLTVEPSEFDFGDISAAAPVSATLQVRNQGNRALTIGDVRTSCGCTTASVAHSNVAAGQATDLQVTFNPQAHPGLYGPLLRIVYLQSNDPDHPEVEVPITVNILAPQEDSR